MIKKFLLALSVILGTVAVLGIVFLPLWVYLAPLVFPDFPQLGIHSHESWVLIPAHLEWWLFVVAACLPLAILALIIRGACRLIADIFGR